jgi:hypothetical protein
LKDWGAGKIINMDELTGNLSKALDFLFLKNPTRTSIGIVLGIVLSGFSPVFAPVLLDLTGFDVSAVHPVIWIALGVLICSLRGSPFKEKLPEDIEVAFDLLHKAEKAGISKDELKTRYKMITDKYIQNIGLNTRAQKELDDIKRLLKEGSE